MITHCPLCLEEFQEGECSNGCWDNVHAIAEEVERYYESVRKEYEEEAAWEPNIQEWRR